jgi:SET domain-containing protein
MAEAIQGTPDMIEVRRSSVHGMGVFALKPIQKGTRLIEYAGERVSHKEADRRYEEKDATDAHTFLFIVDSRTVIDAGVDGNDARFFNHACNPNCESVIEAKRVYIETTRDIAPGEELTYDYQIQREQGDPANIDEVFACHCGAPNCRGTMLWPTKRAEPRKRKAKKKTGATRARNKARTKTGARGKTRRQPPEKKKGSRRR